MVPEHGDIEVVRDGVRLGHLADLAEAGFGDLVKAVVDIQAAVMAIGGGLHADEEAVLLDLGSAQVDLGGSTSTPSSTGRRTGSSSIR